MHRRIMPGQRRNQHVAPPFRPLIGGRQAKTGHNIRERRGAVRRKPAKLKIGAIGQLDHAVAEPQSGLRQQHRGTARHLARERLHPQQQSVLGLHRLE
jgi:hypothetical protein